jgi:F-type H+-transporting ATPase subunit gamma
MANLKAIRGRIKSVKSTQKITRAMQMVAAARVRKAQGRTLATRPFTKKVVHMLQQVVHEANPLDLAGLPLLEKRPETRKVALIVISSDRGLCGSYNTNVFKASVKRIKELKAEGKQISLITIGLKAAGFFKRIKDESLSKVKSYTNLSAIPNFETAKLIAEYASLLYTHGKPTSNEPKAEDPKILDLETRVDRVEIVGTRFINLGKQETQVFNFLPVELPQGVDHFPLSAETIFEPSLEELMEEELLPKYIDNVIYQAMLEASASELAARMNAMSNATSKAGELIQDLTLVYNKARQGDITQQLLEIVGGAEALK